MKELKDLIREQRARTGKTLEEIGKEIGVAKATVQRWESGEIKDMRRDKLVALARALGTTPAYLMGWEDAPNNASIVFSEEERDLILALRTLPPEAQESFHAAIREIAKSRKK